MVFWSGALPPPVAAPLVALCSIAGQLLSVGKVWGSLDLRRAAPMVLGGFCGVPLGVALLPLIDPATFRLCIGLLLCLYCPAMLAVRRLPRVLWGGRWADAAAGVVGGVMGGIAGLNGPAPTLWCMVRGWERGEQRAVFQTFLITAHAAALAGYAVAGLLTAQVWGLSLWLLPSMLLPSLVGAALYTRLGGEAFRRLVLILLLATGLVLVGQGLAAPV